MEQRIVTKPSFYTNIMLLSIPIILQQFLRVSVDLCDSIMLGRIDQVQMAAVSQAQQIFFVFYTVCNGFAVGCSVLIAQYWGLQRKEEIKTLFAIGSKIIAVFAIIISAIVLIRPDHEDLQQRSGSDRTGSFLFKDRGVDVHPMRGEFNVVRMLQGNRADEDLLRGKCGILSDQSDPGLLHDLRKIRFSGAGDPGQRSRSRDRKTHRIWHSSLVYYKERENASDEA